MGLLPSVFPLSLGGGGAGAGKAPEAVGGGSTDLSAVDVLRRHLSSAMAGPGWNAVLAAIAASDANTAKLTEDAFHQLFASSASGSFLDVQAANRGLQRPVGVGMSDNTFRKFIAEYTNNKITLEAVMELLEILYTRDSTRAYITATLDEPYDFREGTSLKLLIDEKDVVEVVFTQGDFTNISQATALEVASKITLTLRQYGLSHFALASKKPDTGGSAVRIYSGSLGLRGSVRVTGGRAQDSLLFPDTVNAPQNAGTTFVISVGSLTSRSRYSWTLGPNPELYKVHVGDYVNIFGSPFAPANSGSFPIVAVSNTWFEIENPGWSSQNVVLVSPSDVIFYRPTKFAVYDSDHPAIASQPAVDTFYARLPVTTQIVQRDEFSAAYLKGDVLTISSASRDVSSNLTCQTVGSHGLQIGDWVILDGLYPDPTAPTGGGGMNNEFQVSGVPSSSSFTVVTPHFHVATTVSVPGRVTIVKSSPGGFGPFLYDPENGLGITAVASSIQQDLFETVSYSVIKVANTTGFPDEAGYIVFNYGFENQVGPVRYLNAPDVGHLILDQSFAFTDTLRSGASVTLLNGRGVFVPDQPQQYGAFILTASTAGKVAADSLIDGILAAGIKATKEFVYPGDEGLGNAGEPASGQTKISDKVWIWGGEDLDVEMAAARGEA